MTEIKEKPILVSSPFGSEEFLPMLLFLIFLFILVIIAPIIGFAERDSINYSAIGVGCMGLMVFIVLFVYILSLKVLTITTSHIHLKGTIGKNFTLERNRIVSFDEEHFKARRGKDWDELVLYTERGMVRIGSLFYTDYKEIKDVLIKDLIRHKNKRIAENNRVITNTLQSSTVLIALGVVCSFSPIQILFHITNVYLEGDEEDAQLNILSEGTFYLLITCVIVFLGLGFMQYKKYKRLLKEMEILEKI